ncbi:hypothetical protein PI124_g4877 [Phytophthora idaei]|nr:hypothetical protein PI125_g21663 [Phytophthora idaei]KAG3134655.1 hypothetical protein PI126_g18598 [Phytophthora idaei]KAG3250462.1 hypothetical protein PI124_g4877 [Phytophthora idaei]
MTNGTYMKHLLMDAFFEGDHVLPETVPVASIKTSMETYLPDRSDGISSAENPLEATLHVDDPAETVPCSSGSLSIADSPATEGSVEKAGVAELAVLQKPAKDPKGATKTGKRKKRRTKKKPATMGKETSGFEIQPLPADPCLKRPRMKQQANVRLSDYVVGLVQATTDVRILTTYKQVLAPVESYYAAGTSIAER